jgi:predicted metalloprotease with PDZ domain
MHVRPVERVGLQYRPVKPTGELWWGEGVTLYFADLMLRRSLLPTSDATRAKHLESLIAAYLFNPAYASISAERVSAADNDPVALGDFGASTHLQGNVLGSMLDLIIMDATAGRRSLSDVMRFVECAVRLQTWCYIARYRTHSSRGLLMRRPIVLR